MAFQTEPGLIAAVAATIGAAVTAFVGSFFSKNKMKADAHASIATGASTAVDAITEVLEQVRVELSMARLEIQQLRTENEQLRESVALLNLRISEMRKEP